MPRTRKPSLIGAGQRPPDELARRVRDLLAPHAHRRVFDAHSLLWSEGDTTGMLVSIEVGRVKLYRTLPNGKAVTLYLFGPGDVIGFMPLLDGAPYPATAEALERVEAGVVDRTRLVQAFRTDPDLALTIVGLFARRLREAIDRIEQEATPEVVPRLATALLSLAEESAGHSPSQLVRLPVSSAEFAGTLGVAPESFSRAVTRLVSERILHRLGPRRFQLLDVSALRRLAGRE